MVEPGASFLEETLGALEIGVLTSSLLYGLTCGQVYLFAVSPKDRPPLVTVLVAFVLYTHDVLITLTNSSMSSAFLKPSTWRVSISSAMEG